MNVDSPRSGSGPIVYDPTSPIPVVQVGDKIDGATVNSFNVYDPLSRATADEAGNPRTPNPGDNMVAFYVSTSAGSMIVRGAHLDSSGDGILDHWKTEGIDIDQDGVPDLNLASMGAKVGQKDMFIEMDWLAPYTDSAGKYHNFAPPARGHSVPCRHLRSPGDNAARRRWSGPVGEHGLRPIGAPRWGSDHAGGHRQPHRRCLLP